ncbi:MAG: protein tyrosine phosphatase family protein [Novosphingobium sp.]|nr:protein tyrosine phosphatase family protein [Novosphingobium sp.]
MAQDPDDIEAWQRLDARTTTSGKLAETDVARLAAIGVRHVINLAPDDRPGALAGEADLLADHGIRYTHIPVPFDAPDDDQLKAFVRAYEADSEPVHVHCIANYRVSAFFYRYNRDLRGMDETQARALMEQQWSPEKSDQPTMTVWAQFIARGGN